MALSSWLGSVSARHSRSASAVSIRTDAPRVRVSSSDMPATRPFTSTGCGASGWRREKARRRAVSAAARRAPLIALSAERRSRAASSGRFRCRISRLPITTWSRLLKSCAMPPVSWPTASIFCACRSCSCAASSSASRALSAVMSRATQ